MMAAGDTSEDAELSERRRDKLSLRIRKEGKISSDLQHIPKNVENDQRNSHELSQETGPGRWNGGTNSLSRSGAKLSLKVMIREGRKYILLSRLVISVRFAREDWGGLTSTG